jgi:hypothetical protein
VARGWFDWVFRRKIVHIEVKFYVLCTVFVGVIRQVTDMLLLSFVYAFLLFSCTLIVAMMYIIGRRIHLYLQAVEKTPRL